MNSKEIQNVVEKLRQEAKDLLNELFGFRSRIESTNVDRFVDVVIMAAYLQITQIQKQAMESRLTDKENSK